jgi:hypothetical protein
MRLPTMAKGAAWPRGILYFRTNRIHEIGMGRPATSSSPQSDDAIVSRWRRRGAVFAGGLHAGERNLRPLGPRVEGEPISTLLASG